MLDTTLTREHDVGALCATTPPLSATTLPCICYVNARPAPLLPPPPHHGSPPLRARAARLLVVCYMRALITFAAGQNRILSAVANACALAACKPALLALLSASMLLLSLACAARLPRPPAATAAAAKHLGRLLPQAARAAYRAAADAHPATWLTSCAAPTGAQATAAASIRAGGVLLRHAGARVTLSWANTSLLWLLAALRIPCMCFVQLLLTTSALGVGAAHAMGAASIEATHAPAAITADTHARGKGTTRRAQPPTCSHSAPHPLSSAHAHCWALLHCACVPWRPLAPPAARPPGPSSDQPAALRAPPHHPPPSTCRLATRACHAQHAPPACSSSATCPCAARSTPA
jgi:hypothetical protein